MLNREDRESQFTVTETEPISYIDSGQDEYEGGTTVQLVATHPFYPTTILWVLNKLELKPSNVKAYKNQPKPPAWGNPGGGMEDNEIERFLERFPNHHMAHFLNDSSVPLYDRTIVACGLREFIDESGYVDVEISPYTYYFRYDRDDRDDNVSIFDFKYRNGHRVKTLFSHVCGFEDRGIVEKDEIAKVSWFDMSKPITSLFVDRIMYPFYPYFSHVRRLMISMKRVHRMSLFDTSSEYCKELVNISSNIHPSWGLVFPVYAGDPRFPEHGFRLNRDNWYKLFYTMVADKMEFASADFIENMFRANIVEAKKREERRKSLGIDGEGVEDSLNEYAKGSRILSCDSDPVDVLLKQDEEWREWIEREVT